ncbi:MAG: DUF4292 domain-containing protein [Mangrovibacterium sp.]
MKKRSFKNSLWLVGLFLLAMASCRAPKTLTVEKLRPLSSNKLIRSIEENAFDYSSLDIKRIACQYETPDNKTSFRASLKWEQDNYIFMTVSKMNIPVARMLLSPDSVKMVNFLEKNYFLGDYAFLEKFISADIDFDVVQSIITNDVFSYRDDPKDNDFREFVSYTDSGMYVLQSLKNRKLGKIQRKGKEEKIDRYLKKLDEEDFVVQYLYVDPKMFKVRKIILDDPLNSRKVQVDFDNFVPVEKQLYPGSIDVHFISPENDLKMKLKLSKFSTENDPDINFNIPEKYKRVN